MTQSIPQQLLKNATWLFGESREPVLRWAADQVRTWTPQLTGCSARFNEDPGTGLSIAVGTPESDERIGKAVSRGLVDPSALGEDDFLLKTTVLDETPCLLIVGRTPRAAAYGVCELFERMGCTFLISGDRLPPVDPALEVPALDEIARTDSAWRGIFFQYCFATNSMFSLSDYEAMFDQMAKLKMNRIVFHHFAHEPFIDYTFRGERKLVGDISHPDSGYMSYGRAFRGSWRVEDIPVGREKFDREKICPPEFQDIANSDEALDTAKAFMRKIIAMAGERGIGVWPTILPQFTTPNLTKYTRPMPRPHDHWCPLLSCTDPAAGPLNRARLEGIMEAYPDIEGVFLSIPEGFAKDPYPETEQLIEREWDHYTEALDLMRQYWGKFWPDPEQQKVNIKADIAFTEITKKTIAEAKDLNPDLKLGIMTVCKAYLLTHLDEILPADMPFIDIESRALWTMDGAPLHLFRRMQGRECAIIPRAVDDGSMAGMQFPLWQYSQDRFLESAEENGTAGLVVQLTHVAGNDHSMRYLADGMWNGKRDPMAFYKEYAGRVFGADAAPDVVKALEILEENDEFLGGRGQKNLPWHMVPPQIKLLRSFRDFDRPFHEAPLNAATVENFEKRADKYSASIPKLSGALPLLEAAREKAPESRQRKDLDYIISRTKGFRTYLQALVDITALFRRYHELFANTRGDLDAFRRGLAGLVGDAARLETRATEAARHFRDCVTHTTDLGVLWMVSHKMVLGSQCLRRFLANIQAFHEGRDYWNPIPWDKLFERSVLFPPYTMDEVAAKETDTDYEPG